MCLPGPFTGGQLVLRHVDHNRPGPRLTRTFDWSVGQGKGQDQLQWVVFNTDTEHEVLPVTEGHRITLTYNLRAVEAQPVAATGEEEQMLLTQGGEGEVGRLASAAAKLSSNSSEPWMTEADVSASAELAAQLKTLMADPSWHKEGERALLQGTWLLVSAVVVRVESH